MSLEYDKEQLLKSRSKGNVFSKPEEFTQFTSNGTILNDFNYLEMQKAVDKALENYYNELEKSGVKGVVKYNIVSSSSASFFSNKNTRTRIKLKTKKILVEPNNNNEKIAENFIAFADK